MLALEIDVLTIERAMPEDRQVQAFTLLLGST